MFKLPLIKLTRNQYFSKKIFLILKINKFNFSSNPSTFISIETKEAIKESKELVRTELSMLYKIKEVNSVNNNSDSKKVLSNLIVDEHTISILLKDLARNELKFDAKEWLTIIFNTNKVFLKKCSLEILNYITDRYATICANKNIELSDLEFYKDFYINKFNKDKSESPDGSYFEFLENISKFFINKLNSNDIDIIIKIYMQLCINKHLGYSDKLFIFDEILFLIDSEPDDFLNYKDEIWANNLENFFFLLMNDFKKIEKRKIIISDVNKQISILSFFRNKYQLEMVWDDLNFLIQFNKNQYGRINHCCNLIHVLKLDFKYFHYEKLIDIFYIDQIFQNDEYEEYEFIAILSFYKNFKNFEKFKSDLIYKTNNFIEFESKLKKGLENTTILNKLKSLFIEIIKIGPDEEFIKIENKLKELIK